MGSPPLARGKGSTRVLTPARTRITPACAGKRQSVRVNGRRIWDHPRLRGEKNLPTLHFLHILGSPPLARGKVKAQLYLDDAFGITPACAGKSRSLNLLSLFCRDHPRLRGEKLLPALHQVPTQGSPPLARGKVNVAVRFRSVIGITPACAGKSVIQVMIVAHGKDHPRLRGEKK